MTWLQLTYASAESTPGRSGGWSVQQVTPETPPAIEAQMRAGVTTRLETLDGLDEFPTTAELAERTRRLAFRFDDDGGSVWWHAVDAGKDATGRPGNVFTHAVAIVGLPDTLRPIDLWRSPCWLVPFGQHEVASAVLRDFEPTGLLHRAAAIERAFARQEETEALLTAVATCIDREWSLVLASESQDEFAAWLSVVSHLTAAPVAAGSLAFCTFDRVARLPQVLEDVRIVGIPTADLAQARGSVTDPAIQRMLVLDLDNLPSTTPGGEWEYAGQRWPSAGLWQEAFFELTDAGRYNRKHVELVLALMDQLAADGKNYRDVGVPLAAALLESCPNETARRELLGQWSERLQLGVHAVEELLCVAPAVAAPTLGAAAEPTAGPGADLPAPETAAPAPAIPSSLFADPGPPFEADPVTSLEVTVSLPEPTDAAEAHHRLAKVLLESPSVLTSDPATRGRVQQWIHDYDRRHRKGRVPDDTIIDNGVNHGRDA